MKNTRPKKRLSLIHESVELEAIRWHERLSGETNTDIEQAFDDWISSSELHRQAYLEAELLAESFDKFATRPNIIEQLTAVSALTASSNKLTASSALMASSERITPSAGLVVSVDVDDQAPTNVATTRHYSKVAKQAMSALVVAACLAMVTVISLDWFDNQDQASPVIVVDMFQNQYHSETGKLKDVVLPDGSKMTLGPNSLVNVSFGQPSRNVELVFGEAYFDVVKMPNRPFFVEADQASVKVVGTRFDVRRLVNSTSVSVVEGIVQVFNGKESARLNSDRLLPTTLLAGQYARHDGKTDIVVQNAIHQQDLAAWVDGRLVYRNAELRDVLADANRYTNSGNIRLDSQELGEKKVTLSVNADNIGDLPLMLAELMNLNISQSSTETVLSVK